MPQKRAECRLFHRQILISNDTFERRNAPESAKNWNKNSNV